jgi:hypothetical protein
MKRLLLTLLITASFLPAQTPLSQAVKRNLSCSPATASGTTYACSISPAPSSYVSGQQYAFLADVPNTGATTINFNSLGPKAVTKTAGGITTALVANDIQAGMWIYLVYDGMEMQMTGPTGNAPQSSGSTINNYTINNSTIQNGACKNCTLGGTELTNLFPNAASTGTTLNKLAKLTGSGTVVISGAGDTGGVIGICTGNTSTPGSSACGTTGSSEIAEYGTFSCVFDGATTANDYVTISRTVAGDCHAFGATYPIGQQVLGRVLVTAAAGTRSMTLFGPESNSSGLRTVQAFVLGATDTTSVGNGKYYFLIPATLNNYRLTAVAEQVISAGTTGVTTVALTRCVAAATGDACSSTTVQMLSTNLTVDSGENSSATAATPAVINTANATVTTGQLIRVDIAAVSTTPALGLIVNMDFTTP